MTSTPAVANGIVYFAAFDGNFYAADVATGALKWKFKTEGERRFAAMHLHGMQPETERMPAPWDCWLSSPAITGCAVRPRAHGELEAVLRNGSRARVSRTYRAQPERLLGQAL